MEQIVAACEKMVEPSNPIATVMMIYVAVKFRTNAFCVIYRISVAQNTT